MEMRFKALGGLSFWGRLGPVECAAAEAFQTCTALTRRAQRWCARRVVLPLPHKRACGRGESPYCVPNVSAAWSTNLLVYVFVRSILAFATSGDDWLNTASTASAPL